MKILIINGSPKGEKSDTLHITNAFVEGLCQENNDAQREAVDLSKLNIEFCKGCFSCWKKGGQCVIEDDVAPFLQKYINSDIVIWSMPLYHYSMPAKAKALMERTLPLLKMNMILTPEGVAHEMRTDIRAIKFVLICGAGFPDRGDIFRAIKTQFEFIYGKGAPCICVAQSPLFNASGAQPLTEPFLDKVTKAGAQFARNGALTEDALKELAKPILPPEQYVDIVNSKKAYD